MGGLDSASDRGLHLKAFWEAYRLKHPMHQVFREHNDSLQTIIPINLLAWGRRTGQTSWQYSCDFNRTTPWNPHSHRVEEETVQVLSTLLSSSQFAEEIWQGNKTLGRSLQKGFVPTKNHDDWAFVLTTLDFDCVTHCHLQDVPWSDQRDASDDWQRVS